MSRGIRRDRTFEVASGFAVALFIAGVIAIPPERATAGESAVPSRSIYHCVIDGEPTFSDQPCGSAATVYEIVIDSSVSTNEAAAVKPVVERAPPARRPSVAAEKRSAEREAKRAAECRRIAQSLQEIRSKMRAGYTVREGERLRARQEKLRQQRRDLSCA